MPIKNKIKQFLSSNNNRQSLLLLGANIFALPVGMLLNVLLARYMGVEDYGNYMFVHNVFIFTVVIFNCGLFQAGNRAIVLTSDTEQRKKYYGALLIYTLILYCIMSICLIVYGFCDQNMREKGILSFFLFAIPSGIMFLLAKFFEVILQADNRITSLAAVSLLPKTLYLVITSVLFLFFKTLAYDRMAVLWSVYVATSMIVYGAVLLKISPSFKDLRETLSDIWKYNKSFGIHLYIGSVFALGMSSLSTILVSYFSTDNSSVALYSLAVMFAVPLSIVPNTIATVYYRQFASQKAIPVRLLFYTLLVTSAGLLFVLVCLPFIIKFFFGADFAAAIALNVIVSIGYIFYGFADFLNRFLGAHGLGKVIRNGAFFTAIILCFCNVLLIPKYIANGAAWSLLIAGIFYFIFMSLSYIKFRKPYQ